MTVDYTYLQASNPEHFAEYSKLSEQKALDAYDLISGFTPRKGKFAIDIDSTLYDFDSAARDAFLKLARDRNDKTLRRGAYCAWTEWRAPADVCGLETWLQVVDMCHQPEVILAQEPFKGSVETLNQLVDSGYDLMYISHRTGEAVHATREWLQNCGFPMGPHVEVICTDAEKKHHIGECQFMIDDRPKTMIEFVYDDDWASDMFGERWALSLSYPYNQALTDIPNIFLSPSWAGLNDFLVRKGFIREPSYA